MSFAERNRLNKAIEDIAALQTMVGELVGRVQVLEAQAAVQPHDVPADPRGHVEAAIATDRMAKARAAKAAKRDGDAA